MKEFLLTFSGYVLAFVGFAFAVVQLRLRQRTDIEHLHEQHRLDQQSLTRQRRYAAYREYLRKLDRIHASLLTPLLRVSLGGPADGDAGKGEPGKGKPEKAAAGNSPGEAVHWHQAQSQALEELNELRLVCSEPVLALLDEYTTTARTYVRELLDAAGRLGEAQSGLARTQAWVPLAALHERLGETKRLIEAHMRADLAD